MAVYDLSSFLEHSCRANCSKSFTAEGGLVIRAAFPISKGRKKCYFILLNINSTYYNLLYNVVIIREMLGQSQLIS